MSKCKGKNCMAVDGVNHSLECIAGHEKAHSEIQTKEEVPSCFDRAIDNRTGGGFDNCVFYNDCKRVKPICCDNPVI